MRAKTAGVAVALLVTACCSSRSLGQGSAITPALDFHTLTPCRAVDTRSGTPLVSTFLRAFQIAGACGVPPTAKVVSANVTVVGPTGSGYVKIWPAGLPETSTSAINFSSGMTRANNGLLTLATDGSGGISAKAFLADSGLVHLVIDVTGYMAGDPVNQCGCQAKGGPLVLIFGISPPSGFIGQSVTIFGQSFAPNVQVLFGDAATGSAASIQSSSSTSINATVPSPPPGFTFSTQPCDGNGDGIPDGTQFLPTPISVNVWNLDGTDCVATLNNAFLLYPIDVTCTGDNSAPLQLSQRVGNKAGVPATQCQCPINGMPLPVISGVTPSSGNTGAPVTISGQNFAPNVQVMFGDATTGASASIQSSSSTSIIAFVPPPPPGFVFSSEPCDSNGITGTRFLPTPISVNVRNLDSTGCVATLSNGFTLSPPDGSCHLSNNAPKN